MNTCIDLSDFLKAAGVLVLGTNGSENFESRKCTCKSVSKSGSYTHINRFPKAAGVNIFADILLKVPAAVGNPFRWVLTAFKNSFIIAPAAFSKIGQTLVSECFQTNRFQKCFFYTSQKLRSKKTISRPRQSTALFFRP